MARAGLLPSFLVLLSPEWRRRAALSPVARAEQLWLPACVCVPACRRQREARAAGRGSSPGPEQLPLILVFFQGTGLQQPLLRSSLSLRPDPLRSRGCGRQGCLHPFLREMYSEKAGSAPLNGRADEVGMERRRLKTRCKCGFRKVLLLSSREFILPGLLNSSSWMSGDFSPSSRPLEKLASKSTLKYLLACFPKLLFDLFGTLPMHTSVPRTSNLPRELVDSVLCD